MTRQPQDGEPGSRVPGTQSNRRPIALVRLQDVLDDPDGIDKLVDMIDAGLRRAGIDIAEDGDDETPLEEFEERT